MKNLCQSLKKYIKNLPEFEHPWELFEFLNYEKIETDLQLREVEGLEKAEVYCGKNVTIQPYTLFTGKVFLGDNVRIGPFCFIRGTTIVGDNSLIGPHAEIIRTVVNNNSNIAHKNILANTIVNNNVNLAAFCSVCNVSFVNEEIKIHLPNGEIHHYNKKYGAYIDSNVSMGALTMIMPGTYIKPDTKIIGQCIVHGNSKIKPMIESKLWLDYL